MTNEHQKSYKNENICYIYKKIEDKRADDKKYCQIRDHCHYSGEYRGVEHSISNLKYNVLKENPIFFCN